MSSKKNKNDIGPFHSKLAIHIGTSLPKSTGVDSARSHVVNTHFTGSPTIPVNEYTMDSLSTKV